MDKLHPLSQQILTLLFRRANQAHPAIGMKLFMMALNNYSANDWIAYLSNELIALFAYDHSMVTLIKTTIDRLREFR